MWFQQDGSQHTWPINEFLRQTFGHWIILRNSKNSWPPHSPDLIPLHYFLWGDINERVYTNKLADNSRIKSVQKIKGGNHSF